MINMKLICACETTIECVRARNNGFRARLSGGTLVISAGIIALESAAQCRILASVAAFDDFELADPADARDIGDLEVELGTPGGSKRELVFFRIDHLSCPDAAHRAERDNASLRLTVLLASEWWAADRLISQSDIVE